MAARVFDWPDYLVLAEELAVRPEEQCLRTAISRAYYYTYHLAKNRIANNGFPLVRGGDTHKQVWEKFDNSPDPRCKKLFQVGKRLKDKRQQADYDQIYPQIEKEFPALLEMTKKFAEDLLKLDPRLPVNTGHHVR